MVKPSRKNQTKKKVSGRGKKNESVSMTLFPMDGLADVDTVDVSPPYSAPPASSKAPDDARGASSGRATSVKNEEKEKFSIPDFGEPLGSDGEYIKDQMLAAKAWVWFQEKDNFDKIFYWRSPGGKDNSVKWWKAGGTSALLMVNVFYPMLGIDRELYGDGDVGPEYKFVTGTTSARGIEGVKEKLDFLGIDLIAENDLVCVFQLRRKYSKDEIDEMVRKAAVYKEFAKKTLVPIKQYKDLENSLREIMKIAYVRYRNGDKKDVDFLLLRYLDVARRAYTKLRDIATGRADELGGFRELEKMTDFLGENLYPLAELGIWGEKTINRIVPIVTKVRYAVKKRVVDAEDKDASI